MANQESAPITNQSTPAEQASTVLVGREVWQNDMAQRRDIGGVALSNLREPFMIKDLEDDKQAEAAVGLLYASDESDPEIAAAMERVSALETTYISQRLSKTRAGEELRPQG